MMNVEEILKSIPHRYPFLMVDRVLQMEHKKTLQAIKNVTINEAFFMGHYPQRPVMPGVLIVEALGQASAVLVSQSYPEKMADNAVFLLAAIDDTRFKRVVEPGDQLLLDIEILSDRRDILKCRGVASVNGEVACTTHLTCVLRRTTPNA